MMIIIYIFAALGVFASVYWGIGWYFLLMDRNAGASPIETSMRFEPLTLQTPNILAASFMRVDEKSAADKVADEFHDVIKNNQRRHGNG